MGHLGNLKDGQKLLLQRLDAGQVGLPEPDDPQARKGWLEILNILFSTEDAWLASRLPNMPSKLEDIVKRTKIKAEDLLPRLNALADKGIVMDIVNPRTKKVLYILAPPVVGFIEFSMMRVSDSIPKKQMALALDAYVHGDRTFTDEIFGTDTVIGRALVHETALQEDQLPHILDWESTTELIKKSRNIAVTNCYCRHRAEHLGKKCDTPLEICISLDAGADYIVSRKFGRKIDRPEAMDLLEQSRSGGLVQIADNVMNRPTYICNCCSCCCGQLQAIKEYDLEAVNPSNYQATVTVDSCRGCSRCARVCPVEAIVMKPYPQVANRKNQLLPQINTNRCLGCGICVSACGKNQAMKMEARKVRPYVSKNSIERTIRMALEKGRLAHLMFDQGAGRGSKFLNKVVKGICSLPKMDKIIASEQLKSRFVKFALKRINDPSV
ncbi:MAG: 4Fe-4S binding protein [Acidobacteriota bacterium]